MPEDGSLRVFLLGRFEVERDAQLIAREAWKRRRPVELLSQLALAPSFVLHREEIIDRLWPDKDLDAGANNLYRTLHELRRIAGPDVACLERGAVRLGDRVWVDVSAFEKAATSGTVAGLEEAMALYRGDLLPDNPTLTRSSRSASRCGSVLSTWPHDCHATTKTVSTVTPPSTCSVASSR